MLVALGGAMPAARSAETAFARIASVTGDGWSVAGIELLVDLRRQGLAGELLVENIELAASGLSFADTRIRCGRVDLTPTTLACADARFSVALPGDAGRSEFSGDVRYDRSSGGVSFELREVPLADGIAEIRGTVTEETVDAGFSGKALSIAGLAALAGTFDLPVAGWSASGSADVAADLRMRSGRIARIELEAGFTDMSVSNEAGTIVSAAAGGRLLLDAQQADDGWQFTVEAAGDSGEAYVEPVYANFAERSMRWTAAGHVDDGMTTVELTRYTFALGPEMEAEGAMTVALPQAEDEEISVSGHVTLVRASLETLYSNLLQVFVAGTLVGDLETAGTLSGTVSFEANAPAAADLTFENLIADDRQSRFAVYELDGEIHWPGPGGSPADAPPSYLHWESARAYDIPLGEARIDARLGGDDVELAAPLRVPTMGGALLINRFALGNFGGDDATGILDASLEPIQLGLLTSAFGWPAFSGTLSGKLPLLQYDGQVVTIGGTLTARAFGGDIELANLRLEQPFGLVPALYGDLRMRRLELEQITNTFSFGLIQGQLSGDVTGLVMVDWQPVAMDLHLYTPEDRPGRRRISQRAVENLASVGGGGGAAAALSSGFMSFFDVFAYRRIGLRCVLENGVCLMSGAAPARSSELGQGYYIVEGSGLPRIDVVGYRRQVDWARLVRQLVQITESGSPTIR